MRVYVLLNLLKELGKSNKMQGLPSILLLCRKEFNSSTNVRFYLSHDIKITKNTPFCMKGLRFCHL